MTSLFNLGILLTRKCNQRCYYCNNFNVNSDFTEIDIDYLDWILNLYTQHIPNIHVELSGGEPGLISNIDQVFELLIKKESVKKVSVLSNGMIRKLGYNLKDVFKNKFYGYTEHFCLEIRDKDILFFYPELPFYDLKSDWIDFVLVLSDVTLDSLLANIKHYQNIYNLPIQWKSITPKKYYPTDDYIQKIEKFFNIILKYNSNAIVDLARINLLKQKNKTNLYKTCSKISIFQFIDLEYKKIGMCSMQVEQSTKYDITNENIKKAITGTLFSHNSFCEKCYKINSKCSDQYIQRKLFKNYNNIAWKK